MNQYTVIVLSIFIVAISAQDTRSETTCQTHRRNSKASNSPVKWDIICNPSTGLYEPLQCTESTPRWCACYNTEESITQPSRSTTNCECYLAKDNAIKNSASTCEIPECQRNGKFEKKQCCESTGKCYCVDETTGQRTTEPTNDPNLRC